MINPKAAPARGLVKIGGLLFVVVGSGLASSVMTGPQGVHDFGGGFPALAMMLAGVGIVTFFGVLSLPTEGDDVTRLTEPRMRLALTAALVLTYLVYFSVAAWRAESGVQLSMPLLETLTGMIMVVLPFYFGATAAVEIARAVSQSPSTSSKQDSTDRPIA
jgi:hypothetical protein